MTSPADTDQVSPPWTAADGAALYGLDRWGDPYFAANARGHVCVQPQGVRGGSLDLVELVKELRGRNLSLPLLIRFDDILEDRLERLHGAFERAIAQYGYAGRYQGVFPVKCNQQRHVVEQLVESGRRWHFGLEAGSKAELLIALSLVDDPQALLICNGYKDQRYIETAILARRLGRQPVVVIEQADEVGRIIAASQALGAAPLIGIRAKLSTRSTGRWGSSVGEKAKFGLSVPDLLATVEALRQADLLGELRLLHFHIGSQINDIAVLKDALQEAGRSTPSSPAWGRRWATWMWAAAWASTTTAAAPPRPPPRTTPCRTTPTTWWPPCASAARAPASPYPPW